MSAFGVVKSLLSSSYGRKASAALGCGAVALVVGRLVGSGNAFTETNWKLLSSQLQAMQLPKAEVYGSFTSPSRHTGKGRSRGNMDDFWFFVAGCFSVVAIILGVTAGIALSNANTNHGLEQCVQYAAQNHMYADCPAHLVSRDPIHTP